MYLARIVFTPRIANNFKFKICVHSHRLSTYPWQHVAAMPCSQQHLHATANLWGPELSLSRISPTQINLVWINITKDLLPNEMKFATTALRLRVFKAALYTECTTWTTKLQGQKRFRLNGGCVSFTVIHSLSQRCRIWGKQELPCLQQEIYTMIIHMSHVDSLHHMPLKTSPILLVHIALTYPSQQAANVVIWQPRCGS